MATLPLTTYILGGKQLTAAVQSNNPAQLRLFGFGKVTVYLFHLR